MKEIALSGPKGAGKFTIVDDEFEYLKKFTWWYSNGYAHGRLNGKTVLMHRLIMNVTDRKIFVDHINRIRLDNRVSNLRLVSPTNNVYNSSGDINNCTSSYKGVCWDSRMKHWLSMIRYKGKTYNLGHYLSQEEAAVAYNLKTKELCPEFMYQNDVDMTIIPNKLKRIRHCSYKGVHKNGTNWVVCVFVTSSLRKYFGSYKNKEIAAQTYDFVVKEFNLNRTINNMDLSSYIPSTDLLKKIKECRQLLLSMENKETGYSVE